MTSPTVSLDFYTLLFDGGSRGNPGEAFGSFQIQLEGEPPEPPIRLRFGLATNNAAEYQALLAGVRALLARLREAGIDPSKVGVEIRGDSRLVLNQVEGTWKARNPQMRSYRDAARRLLEPFGAVRLVHQTRWHTLQALGH